MHTINQKIRLPENGLGLFIRSRFEVLLVAFIVFATRWSTLMQPLVERHDFRQTQTAFTTLTIADGAGGLFSSKLPLFGSPWELPLEFPLFQFIASIPYRVFDLNIDFANRVTALVFFCLCLFPLQAISLRYMTRFGAFFACLLFAFSPLAIQWSRASLIEYCAVFFGLLFVSYSLRYWDKPSWGLAAIATVSGAFTGLVKVTTLIPMLVFLVVLVLSVKNFFTDISANLKKILGATGILFAVLLTSQLWVKFSDHIRASNPATLWLTQSRLNEWNFGTFEQRQQFSNWKMLYERIDQLIAPPSTIIILLFVGLIYLRSRRIVVAASLSVLLTVGVFFNLYVVHDYYLIAISVMIAFVVAGTTDAAWSRIRIKKTQVIGWILIPILAVGYSVVEGQAYWASAYNKYPRLESELGQLSQPDQQVFVSWDGWNPLILYYANRKGMMLDPRSTTLSYLSNLQDLNKYDFYAGNPDRPDVVQIRGFYSPVGPSTTRIDDSMKEFESYGLVFSRNHILSSQQSTNTALISCDGANVFELRKIPVGSIVHTTAMGTAKEFGVSLNLQTVPVGKSIKILGPLPEENTGRLVCGGGGYVRFNW